MRGAKMASEEPDLNIQVLLKSSANHTPIRNLKATNIF